MDRRLPHRSELVLEERTLPRSDLLSDVLPTAPFLYVFSFPFLFLTLVYQFKV